MVVKSFNHRQQMKIFKQNGFEVKRANGSHRILQNSEGVTIIIAVHNNKMSDTAFNKTLKEYNLSY